MNKVIIYERLIIISVIKVNLTLIWPVVQGIKGNHSLVLDWK